MKRTMLALVVVFATLLTGAPVSATDPCGEYLEAKAVYEGANRLWEQQPENDAAGELAGETAARWRQAREAVIASLRADGNDRLGRILVSWEKVRNASEIAVLDTMFWFMLAGGQNLEGESSAEFIAVSDAMDAIHAAEHATITVACDVLHDIAR